MSERLAFGHGTSGNGSPAPALGADGRLPVTRPAQGRGEAVLSQGQAVLSGEPAADGVARAGKRPDGSVGERRDWAFVGLMTFTALLFFRPQDTIPVLDGLHLAEMSAIGALAAMVMGRLRRGQTISRLPAELTGVIALGACILLLAPFSIWMGGAVGTLAPAAPHTPAPLAERS